ncbi:hypothetical protein I7I50_02423 [Histoplasma capsulatum G186AR]|uniref:Uncharacterized protein n=1 Tax=Ajellomyces capsulatus TaxID=5037 RepID=A0A8H7Z8K6_AJECA|nr:hypothetical protein I7I52_00913 [Histoplasma capsulatum]QSS71556.1 hypothetical protein I7I50_02423 [Histoplasma capsulatum G186AR]
MEPDGACNDDYGGNITTAHCVLRTPSGKEPEVALDVSCLSICCISVRTSRVSTVPVGQNARCPANAQPAHPADYVALLSQAGEHPGLEAWLVRQINQIHAGCHRKLGQMGAMLHQLPLGQWAVGTGLFSGSYPLAEIRAKTAEQARLAQHRVSGGDRLFLKNLYPSKLPPSILGYRRPVQ